jgi:hypothetical protein
MNESRIFWSDMFSAYVSQFGKVPSASKALEVLQKYALDLTDEELFFAERFRSLNSKQLRRAAIVIGESANSEAKEKSLKKETKKKTKKQ